MALPIWTHSALRSEPRPYGDILWRCVEAQHVVSTMPLVDTLEEQALLEDILEDTKPPVPPECEGLHYLYMTPFRYGLYPNGSRFRCAGRTPGVFYASMAPETAVAETAFHLLLFYAHSPATPFPKDPTQHLMFDVPVKTQVMIDLTELPFSKAKAQWTSKTDYGDCQALEAAARASGVDLIVYTSVRDPQARKNAALLSCSGFAAPGPSQHHSWKLWFNPHGVHAIEDFGAGRFDIKTEAFAEDPRLKDMVWDR